MSTGGDTTAEPAVRGVNAADLAGAAFDIARRFKAGATMWCVAPTWPSHAHHLAVEFVHPVIVGKRALPAVAVDCHDIVADLRVATNPGDLLVAISPAGDEQVKAVMRRAPAWGAHTVWIGAGPRPAAGAADHVLWLDCSEEEAAFGGGYVLVYHLLWELAHVCNEHGGLLTVPPPECTDDICVTCADEGRLAEVVSATGETAVVRTATGTETIDTYLIASPSPGDLVLVHAGAAVTSLEG